MTTPIKTKTSTLSPQSRAIVEHMQALGRQTFEQLHGKFREPSYHRSDGPNGHQPNPAWLRNRLNYMLEAGHVTKKLDQGVWYYDAAYPTGTPAGPRRSPQREKTEPLGDVVPPRRIYVMGSDTYTPPKAAAPRAGSMDFAECPSLDAGRRLPFTPGKAIYG